MIATMEGASLLEEADHLAKMITDSETAEHYRACKHRLQEDEEAQALIARFGEMKEKYEEVQRFGRFHPEYDTVTKEVREVKREVDMNDSVAAFKRAERNLKRF